MKKELEAEMMKWKRRAGSLQSSLLREKKHINEVREQSKLEAVIKTEKQLIPRSRFGKFLLDIILTTEKYFVR